MEGLNALRAEREAMVQTQLRGQGIKDQRVLAAMEEVPRHRFVPAELWDLAYRPQAVDIGLQQTISQPFMVARMTELLEPEAGMRVLEIGTGSGYQAAVLGWLGCLVLSVERLPQLSVQAGRTLRSLRLEDRIGLVVGDGSDAPFLRGAFERILVTAAAPRLPQGLSRLLSPGGRMICPVGDRDWQKLAIVDRSSEGLSLREAVPCRFVPLIGREGFGPH